MWHEVKEVCLCIMSITYTFLLRAKAHSILLIHHDIFCLYFCCCTMRIWLAINMSILNFSLDYIILNCLDMRIVNEYASTIFEFSKYSCWIFELDLVPCDQLAGTIKKCNFIRLRDH